MTNRMGSMILALSLLASSQAFAEPLTGTYEVVKSGCDDTGNLIVGQKAIVQADNTGLRISDSMDLESAFSFQTGTERVSCMGYCYFLYTGSYSSDGQQFKSVVSYVDTLPTPAAAPVYAGEVDFTLAGDVLEIKSTTKGQGHPSDLTVCVLKKV